MSKPRVTRKVVKTEKEIHVTAQGLEDGRWWLVPSDNPDLLASRINTVLERNYKTQEFLRTEMATSWRLYENTPIAGLTPRLYRPRTPSARLNRVSWNLVKSVVDTYVALIVKETPKVSFVTSGGNRTLQRRAEMAEKFVTGVLYENRFGARLDQQCVRDCAVFGSGIVKVYACYDNPKKPCIKIDRMRAWEDHTDSVDAAYGDPMCKQFTSWVDKFALAEQYPDHSQKILTANTDAFMDGGTDSSYGLGANQDDKCVLIESWHLPTIPGSKDDGGSGDGRHVLSIGPVILVDEPWARADFGLCYLYRQRPIQGIWGQSLPVELAPLQVEIAKLLHNISLAMKRAVGHWLVEQNSEVNTNAMDDRPGSIWKYTGVKPEYQVFQTVAPEVFEHLNTMWQRGFESVGISVNMAASERPSGLDTGKAQLVYADIQQQRFVPCYREYQQFYVDIARAIMACAREIQRDYPDFEVSVSDGKSMMQAVKWIDAAMGDDEFTLELVPTNKLADDPAAQLEYVQNAINANLMDIDTGKRMLGTENADIAEYNSYEFAPYDYVMTSVDKMLDDGVYVPPDPNLEDYLPTAIVHVGKAYLKAIIDQVPEKNRLLLIQWIKQAKSYLAPPAPPPGAPPPGPPGAMPPGPPPPGALPPGPGGPPGASPIAGLVQRDLAHQQAAQTAQQMG